MNLENLTQQSLDIRSQYHQLEEKYHGSRWSVEEDALAFLTDAGLVGRYAMAQQGRWPSEDSEDLAFKIGECTWWLAVLAERMGLSYEECVQTFLSQKQEQFGQGS